MAKHIARICQPVLLLVENRAEKALGNHFTGSGRRNRFDLIESRDPPDSGELIQKLVDFQFATSEHGLAAAEQQHVEVVNRAVCLAINVTRGTEIFQVATDRVSIFHSFRIWIRLHWL
jgi:hypothetical protein